MNTIPGTTPNTSVMEKGHPFFSKLSFVLIARSTDDDREYMQILHVEDEKAICTDGRRLHIYSGDLHLEPGDYKVLSANKSQIILAPTTDYTFPDWKRVVPKKEEYKKVEGTLDMDCASLKKTELNRLSKEYFAFIKQTDCLLDLTFFAALSDHTWEVYYGENHESVLFENKELTAVIMPMQQAV